MRPFTLAHEKAKFLAMDRDQGGCSAGKSWREPLSGEGQKFDLNGLDIGLRCGI